MDILKELKLPWKYINKFSGWAGGIVDSNGNTVLHIEPKLGTFIVNAINSQHVIEQGFEEWHKQEHPEHYEEDTGDLLIDDDVYAARKKGWLARGDFNKAEGRYDIYGL